MNKLICRGGKTSNVALVADDIPYGNLIDFKWTISVADQYSNFFAQAENNQDSAPYVWIEGPNCELEYESTHGLWKVVSNGTPAGTAVYFNGSKLDNMLIQVLIVAYGLSAEVSPGS